VDAALLHEIVNLVGVIGSTIVTPIPIAIIGTSDFAFVSGAA
jgi:hypothetical protein